MPLCWRVGNAFQAVFTVFSKIYSEMPGPSVLENGEKFVVLLCSESGVSVFRNRRGYSIIEVASRVMCVGYKIIGERGVRSA